MNNEKQQQWATQTSVLDQVKNGHLTQKAKFDGWKIDL